MKTLVSVLLAAILTGGCVHPAPRSWRLVNGVLVPPGIAGATVVERNVEAPVVEGRGKCPTDVTVRNKKLMMKMTRHGLSNQPPGWLTNWTAGLESQGCIGPGEALRLAAHLSQALPLDINGAFRLLYPNDRLTGIVEIGPNLRLQVISPIMAEGARADVPLIEIAKTTGTGNSLSIDANFTEDVLGYEIAWYVASVKRQLPGISIAALSAERHIKDQTERRASPIHNYFDSLIGASFYGLFYKGGQTDFTVLIVGAPTKADLDRRTGLLQNGIASCETLNNDMCVAIPRSVAVNPMILVKVNDADQLFMWGATVGTAIREAGGPYGSAILRDLSVLKPYGIGSAPIEFNRTDPAILSLMLMGGETISWK